MHDVTTNLPSAVRKQFPFQSRFHQVTPKAGQHLRMHYVDEGMGDETILMVHGNPTWSFYYRNLIEAFKDRYRVIALDHIGSGLSDKPEQYPYRLDNHISNLNSLVRSLGVEKVHLVVHDWGGPIGLGWATQFPHLISSMTILNTAAFCSDDVPKRIQMCRLPVIGEFLVRRFNAFAGMAPYMAAERSLSKEVKSGYLYPYNSYKNRIGVARFVQDIPMEKSHPSYSSLATVERNLSRMRCPKLVIWGDKDFCFHTGFRKRWEAIFPDAKVLALPTAGHLVLEDEPNKCINAMESFYGSLS